MLDLFEEPKQLFEEKPPVTGVTIDHVRLTALMSVFVTLLAGCVFLSHGSWSEILALLGFIPGFWFGLLCAWTAK